MAKVISSLRNWWNKYSRVLKMLFVASVVIFVIIALSNFLKEVDWVKVGDGLRGQSLVNIIIMTVGGIVAVVPMLGYDIAITHLLPGNFKPRSLATSSAAAGSPTH